MTAQPDERATILDVARLAGVAISSASSALNDRPGVSAETRERVKRAARQLHYVPSFRGRSLSGKKAFAVGLILERDFTVLEADPFFGAFIGGLEESLAPHNYAVLLQIVDGLEDSVARHIELVDSRRVDGIVLSELRVDDPRIPAFASRNVAVVGINPAENFPFPSVTQDNAQAIHDLVHGLKLMGHNEIAFVSGPRDYVHSMQRLDAWRSAARKEEVAHSRVLHGDFTHESGVAAANELLASGTIPSAVFCANDLMAIGFQNRLHELGMRIPDDIAIAGFDGIPLSAYVRPALTTVATDPHGLGREAGRLLVSQISGDGGEASTIGPAELVWRDSTGPMRR